MKEEVFSWRKRERKDQVKLFGTPFTPGTEIKSESGHIICLKQCWYYFKAFFLLTETWYLPSRVKPVIDIPVKP